MKHLSEGYNATLSRKAMENIRHRVYKTFSLSVFNIVNSNTLLVPDLRDTRFYTMATINDKYARDEPRWGNLYEV